MSEKIDFIENELGGLSGIGIYMCDTCKKPARILLNCKNCTDNFCLKCVSKHNHNPKEE